MLHIVLKAKKWAKRIKMDIHAVWLAARDPRTPWFVRVLAMAIAAYAISPIDLIPDFIPIIGYLDDLLIVPLGIMLIVRLIPPEVLKEKRKAAAKLTSRPVSYLAATMVILVWCLLGLLMTMAYLRR
ncbi:DUF1232 domain-containing protein [Aeromonas jandaei]|uniref:YkvA family protein n=2 Tax=Aeromonas TaxID=642 RepID=UPI00191F0F19|nr:DUF1232 domain-containing protein [Aeromonas jandaei]MBL0666282.1 DUF1232 domain-containing protein [Aeromonas jandaei]